MIIKVFPSKVALAMDAAKHATDVLRKTIAERGEARIIAATGAAQFDFLEVLTATPGIDWKRVEMFHLDEYVGISDQAPASFCRFLKDRLIDKVGIGKYHLLDGTKPPRQIIETVTAEIRKAPIDLAFVGVGENGHLAFNDPPADFDTDESYIVVNLDEPCRQQQLGEGWFPSLEDVPKQAISMTVRQIMQAKEILAIVPEMRKAKAIKACFDDGIGPDAPASMLQKHPKTTIYLDTESASLLSPASLDKYKG